MAALNEVPFEAGVDAETQTDPIRQDQVVRRRSTSASGKTHPQAFSPSSVRSESSDEGEIYLVELCRAFMRYGAPTHRLEEYARQTAEALGLQLQTFYMPGCMVLSISATPKESPHVHVVRDSEGLTLSKLDDAHQVHKKVVHKQLAVQDAISRLHAISAEKDLYPRWLRILTYGLASAFIGPVSYGARPVDLPIMFLLGSLLGFLDIVLVPGSELYSHVFELSAAIVISFLARAFGSIDAGPEIKPCFSAICQGSLVMILPGLTITRSALELQSRNLVSGSVRMVYGIIFVLFLAFGITIGVTIFAAMDSSATSATTCSTEWPFWWRAVFVAPFTFCYIIVNQGRWASMPGMIVVSCVGWFVNYFVGRRFTENAQVTQAISALAIGTIANLCSRLGLGLAIALLLPAVFLQVPGSFAASGSLISGLGAADQLIHNSTRGSPEMAYAHTAILNAGYSMVEIAIGITVGLSVSLLLVYPFRKSKGKSGLFSF